MLRSESFRSPSQTLKPSNQYTSSSKFIFWRKIWWKKKNILSQNSLFFKKHRQKDDFKQKILPTIVTIAYNMKGCLRFANPYFEHCQNWLNTLMDDCHLRNITIFLLKKIAHEN